MSILIQIANAFFPNLTLTFNKRKQFGIYLAQKIVFNQNEIKADYIFSKIFSSLKSNIFGI